MKYVQHVSANGHNRTFTTIGKKELHTAIISEAAQGRFLCLQEHANLQFAAYCFMKEPQLKILGAYEKRITFLGGRNIPIYELPSEQSSNTLPQEAQDTQD